MDILHIKQQLELARTGNEQAKQVFVKTTFEALDYNRLRYLRLLQPEDKAWLLAENCCESLCIVLATMYIHKVREWEEIFTDEQTGEQVPITRTEELRETVFEQNEVEAKELFDKACKLNEGHCYFKSFIDCLEYTPFDTTSLLLEEIEREENIIEEIRNLIENKKIKNLREYLETINSADFPSILEEFDDENLIMIYRLLSKEKAVEVNLK